MELSSKNLFWSLVNIVLIIAVILGAKFSLQSWTKVDQSRLITVSAEGKVTVTPDIGRISFSVVSEGKDPKTIQAENTAKMNKAIAFIKSEGVDAKDIKTSNYNLFPVYDYNVIPFGGNRTPFIVGYRITQTVDVKVRDLAKMGDILGALPDFGINEINTVGFEVDEPERYLNEAREEAFDKAYEKAKTMAELNGTRIKRVVTFSEGGGGIPRYYALEAAGKGGAPDVPAPQIEPGSQEVIVTVNVTYEIR